MDIKFSKNSVNSQPGATEEKKKQGPLVVLLLILIGGFTYIYFFTDLIKPQESQKVAAVPAPAAAPQTVKMPLPPRDGEPVKPSEKTVATSDAAKAPATAVAPVAAPAAKPVAAAKPATEPAKAPAVPAAKSAQTTPPPKPVEPPKKPEAVKTPDKKTVPAAVAGKKPDTASKTETNGTATKDAVKKPVAGVPAKAKPAATKPWTIVVGNYLLEKDLSAALLRVRKSGFEPVVKPGTRKKAAMNRLLVSEFNDRASAKSMLENLSRHTSDAFIIEQGGKFVVYAGSYLQIEAANQEKERLNGAGFSTTLKTASISIPSQILSVGPFKNKESAESARGKLKNAGIKATLSQQ